MYELRQLQVLVEVARTGSYTAAAQSLGYSQPAVSYQMSQLQRRVGSPLAVRAGRGLQLTQAGRLLVQHANAALAVLRAAEEDLATLNARGAALVRVAAFQSALATLIPPVTTRLRRTDPGLRLTLQQAEPPEARVLLRNGEADLGLLCMWENDPLPDGENSMTPIPLLAERRCVVLRRDHPLATGTEVDFGELAAEHWVMESSRDRFEAACTQHGFTPRIAATVDDQVTAQTLVAAGLGVTLMNELALASHLDRRLIARPLRDWPLRRTYALLWPDMAAVPPVAALLDALRRTASGLRLSTASPAAGC